VEAQTDIQTYLEQGKQELAQGHAREAAIAYAHGAQLDPDNPIVHLGLAEANLALGNYGVVQMACRRVQELQPDGGLEARIAQALLDLLNRRYERALQQIDAVISEDPSIAYTHSLRSHLLRISGQDYDANLARARAARLSYGGRFDNCFPPLDLRQTASSNNGYNPVTTAGQYSPASPLSEREAVPTWSRPGQVRRQIIRTRFALSQYPALITNILIAINLLVFLLGMFDRNVEAFGQQINFLVWQGEYWRIFTAMFLHAGPLHIALNMFSLYFVGRAIEMLYGKWRYFLIYLFSGICGGVSFLFLSPSGIAVGASGAIFGIFGALGVFYLINRRALGQGGFSNWLLWLGLNLAIGFVPGSGIAIWGHIGGLVGGMIISFLLVATMRKGGSL
jgi:membrane associated rhomboid family serine protease